MRSGTDVGRLGLVYNRSSKVLDGVEVRALCRAFKFFPTDLDKQFLYGPRFEHRGEIGTGLPQTVDTKLEAQNCLECHCIL